jgi:hypothetical protein
MALAAAEDTQWNVVTRAAMILAVNWTTSTSFSALPSVASGK